MRITILLLFFTAFLALFSFQHKAWQSKVDEEVLESTVDGGQTDFLVVMREQMVVPTGHLHTKAEKGEYVFRRLKKQAEQSQADIRQWLTNNGIPFDAYFIVNLLHVEGDYALVKALAQRPDVARINANPVVHQDFYEGKPSAIGNEKTLPWGITKIKADQVWALGYQGSGVVVGGQDTGYDWEHPALKNKYRGWDGSTANHNYNWHDAIHAIDAGNTGSNPCGLNSPVPCDDHGHGTHTMGTMVGDDGAGNQIGVAPAAKWIGCRNMERGDGTPMTYIECFEWFLAPTDLNNANPDPSKAPDVINNSWGCPPSEGCNTSNFATMETALNNLKNSGVVVVVSAGNSGSACSSVDDPAAIYQESFTVGAMDINDNIANFSSRGPVTVDGSNRMKPNISAPGVNVKSSIPGANYANYSGTSMAGPHVAGTVALIISAMPSLSGNPDAIENILEQTATAFTSSQNCGNDNSSSIPNNVFGYGEVDALAAVNQALPLEWISFEAIAQKKSVRLIWKIARQENIKGYVIERSSDAHSFEKIGEKSSHFKQADDFLTYQFDDFHPGFGRQYYRIKVLENDGTFFYSKLISLQWSGISVNIGPNPFSNHLSITVTPTQEGLRAILVSQDGHVLQSIKQKTPVRRLEINELNSYPVGIYLLIIYKDDNPILVEKVMRITTRP